MMRLFVAIPLPDQNTRCVERFIDQLRPLAAIDWSTGADLHVTTKFIGQEPPERAASIERELRALERYRPFALTLRGVGWFPTADAPRIFWAGVDQSLALASLASETDRVLGAIGVERTDRAYIPHVSLAGIDADAQLTQLHEALAASPVAEFGSFIVDSFVLFESQHENAPTRYRTVAKISLMGAAGV